MTCTQNCQPRVSKISAHLWLTLFEGRHVYLSPEQLADATRLQAQKAADDLEQKMMAAQRTSHGEGQATPRATPEAGHQAGPVMAQGGDQVGSSPRERVPYNVIFPRRPKPNCRRTITFTLGMNEAEGQKSVAWF